MGVSWNAGLFYGVVLEPFRKTTKVTKYNPDTGVPYQKSVEVLAYRLPAMGDQKAHEIAVDDLDEDFSEGYVIGGYYNDNKLLGIPVAMVYAMNGCTTTKAFSAEDVAGLEDRFRKLILDTFDNGALSEKILSRAGLAVFIYAS